MNALLLASWIAAALVGGCGAATLLRARDRVAMTPGLGAALVVATFLLLGTSAGLEVQAWGAPALVGIGGVLALGVTRAPGDCGCAEDECERTTVRRRARAGTAVGLVLLAAAAWLYPVGSMRLDPGEAFLTQTAPLASQVSRHGEAASHPLGAPVAAPAAAQARLLGAVGGDTLETGQALAGAFQVLAVLALFGGLRAGTVHALAAVLGVGAMLAGTPHSWLATTGLEGALAHLLGAGALAVLLSASGAASGAVVALLLLALSLVEPGVAWPLALLAAAAPWLPGTSACSKERHAQTGLALAACVGVFSLGGAPFADLRFTAWTALLPVALWLAWRHCLRAPLLLGLGEVLVLATGGGSATGPGFGASVLAAGAVFATVGELLGRAWDQAAPGHWALRWRGELFLSAPWRALVAVAVLFLVVQGFEPGETALNRNVLLAGQKKQLSVQQLFAPLPLEDWVRTRGADFGLQPGDVERAAALRDKPAVVVTVRVEREPLLPSAVIATMAGTALPGWRIAPEDPRLVPGGWNAELEPAVELARLRASNQAAAGERLLLRQPLCAEEGPTIASGPTDEPLTARWKGAAAPGSLVEIEVSPALRRGEVLGYHVTRDGEAWSRIPVETPAGRPVLFPVPRTPGVYLLHFYRRPAGAAASKGTDLGGGRLPALVSDPGALGRLQAQVAGLGTRLPSRSLVPFELVLRNPARLSDSASGPNRQPVSLARFEALRLELDGADAYPEERRGRLQPLLTSAGLAPGVLEPGAEVHLRVLLPTPLTEGTFRARPVLVDAEGGSVPLDLEIPFRTWRRIPPGGAW